VWTGDGIDKHHVAVTCKAILLLEAGSEFQMVVGILTSKWMLFLKSGLLVRASLSGC